MDSPLAWYLFGFWTAQQIATGIYLYNKVWREKK